MTRWWGENIRIDGRRMREYDDQWTTISARDAEQWEVEVQDLFRKLETSVVGKQLLTEINQIKGKILFVLPIRSHNSHQTAVKPFDWPRAMKANLPFPCGPQDSCERTAATGPNDMSPHSRLLTGMGHGSSVQLYFSPGRWKASAQMRAVDELAGLDLRRYNYKADDVLFHECVHAYRAMLGIFEFVPVNDAWDFTEEFISVVITNIYVSETRPGDPLRGDHKAEYHSLREAGRPEGDVAFYGKFFATLDRLRGEMKGLIDPLASNEPSKRVGTWNPFRAGAEEERKKNLANTVGDLTR